MKKIIVIAVLMIFTTMAATAVQGCTTTWVDSVSADGSTVVLENDTVWSVAPGDEDESSDWMVSDDVTSCGNSLHNDEWDERVSATRVR